MAKKSCIAGEFIVEELDSGSISIYKVYDNVKGGLREAAAAVGLDVDPAWTTRQLGSKLINFVNAEKH